MSGLDELSRDELIALTRALTDDNARLNERVAVLEAENAELLLRVAWLEWQISRNSGNSSMPPSADDLPGRPRAKDKPAPSAGQRGKRRPGKQPGAPGAAPAWDDAVDPRNVLDHFPAGACGCGAEPADATDLGVTARHQQVEIPLVVAQPAHGGVRLREGAHRAAARGVPAAPVSLGINPQSWCVYLMVAHAIPVHRCTESVASLAGAELSPGFVHGLLRRAAAAVAQVDDHRAAGTPSAAASPPPPSTASTP